MDESPGRFIQNGLRHQIIHCMSFEIFAQLIHSIRRQ
jgi:hypothetical protein